MKSGPTLNGATVWPACRSAPIKPVATVVFPLPDAGAAITTASALISALASPARSREPNSPLDALLALAAGVHRMLHLGHFRDQISGVEQRLGGLASGNDDVLDSGTAGQ